MNDNDYIVQASNAGTPLLSEWCGPVNTMSRPLDLQSCLPGIAQRNNLPSDELLFEAWERMTFSGVTSDPTRKILIPFLIYRGSPTQHLEYMGYAAR